MMRICERLQLNPFPRLERDPYLMSHFSRSRFDDMEADILYVFGSGWIIGLGHFTGGRPREPKVRFPIRL